MRHTETNLDLRAARDQNHSSADYCCGPANVKNNNNNNLTPLESIWVSECSHFPTKVHKMTHETDVELKNINRLRTNRSYQHDFNPSTDSGFKCQLATTTLAQNHAGYLQQRVGSRSVKPMSRKTRLLSSQSVRRSEDSGTQSKWCRSWGFSSHTRIAFLHFVFCSRQAPHCPGSRLMFRMAPRRRKWTFEEGKAHPSDVVSSPFCRPSLSFFLKFTLWCRRSPPTQTQSRSVSGDDRRSSFL